MHPHRSRGARAGARGVHGHMPVHVPVHRAVQPHRSSPRSNVSFAWRAAARFECSPDAWQILLRNPQGLDCGTCVLLRRGGPLRKPVFSGSGNEPKTSTFWSEKWAENLHFFGPKKSPKKSLKKSLKKSHFNRVSTVQGLPY